jgi:hypothetical protein
MKIKSGLYYELAKPEATKLGRELKIMRFLGMRNIGLRTNFWDSVEKKRESMTEFYEALNRAKLERATHYFEEDHVSWNDFYQSVPIIYFECEPIHKR